MSSNQQLWQHIYGAVGLEPPAPQNTSTVPTLPRPISFEESVVSSLELHHHVDVNYPSINIKRHKNEKILLNKPLNAEQRHAPALLIEDRDVNNNAYSFDSSFSSMYKATPMQLTQCKFSKKNLIADMEEVIKCHGYTKLGAVLVKAEDKPIMIRFRRGTYFRHFDDAQSNEHTYEIALERFLAVKLSARWYQDLIHLIGITDDRASRHVHLKLVRGTEPEILQPDVGELYWKFMASFGKPERRPDYLRFINQGCFKIKKGVIFSKSKTCIGCQNSIGPKQEAFELPCRHVMGQDCLLELFKRPLQDSAQIVCPCCQSRIFVNKEILEEMKFGVVDGVYQNDFKFTHWENFERSCADLDKREARENDFRIVVNPDLLIATWYKMVHDGMEPGTLQHLKPVLTPEFKILERTFITHVQRLDGVSTTISNLNQWLKKQVFKEFHSRWLAAGLDSTLGHLDRGRWFKEDEILRKLLPVGFTFFLRRVLNRTLQFQSLRICSCAPAGQGEQFHKHGGREYYDPKAVVNVETQTRKEMYLWQRGKQGKLYLKDFAAEDNKRHSQQLQLQGKLA